MHTDIDKQDVVDFEAMAELNLRVLDALTVETEAALCTDDKKALTDVLRASGLALSNLTKLYTLKKRICPDDDDDDSFADILQNAKERANLINGKAKKD